jgi:general secretion pathway protein F
MARDLSLDELIALNDEVAALARAGVPLGHGLLGLGDDIPGSLGRVAATLGAELERGTGFDEALRRVSGQIPETYGAVVEAGLRSGRLGGALEDSADYARGVSELHRVIGQAFFYPLIVVTFGYGLFLAFLIVFVPRVSEAFASLGVPSSRWVLGLEWLGRSVYWWGALLPLAVASAVGLWLRLGRARGLDATHSLRWVPWLSAVMADWRTSNFAGWMALLTKHEVPLGQSLELAGRASGDPRFLEWSRQVADDERRGTSLEAAFATHAGLPPLLRWLLITGIRQGRLYEVLRHAAELYRRRAMLEAEALRTAVPALLLATIGGCSALVYILAIYLPWSQLMNTLARSTG